MNFCAKCGRDRSGDARYCGGCGTEFAAASAASGTPPADDTGGGDPGDVARVGVELKVAELVDVLDVRDQDPALTE